MSGNFLEKMVQEGKDLLDENLYFCNWGCNFRALKNPGNRWGPMGCEFFALQLGCNSYTL